MTFTLKNLTSLVTVAITNKASDIHIRHDEAPSFRIRGELVPVQTKPFGQNDIIDIIKILIQDDSNGPLTSDVNEFDGAYQIPELCRLRFNIYKYFQNYGIVLRIVNSKIPSLNDLGFPAIISQIALHKRGLTLVTGPTGSGKSTTLAAMIDHINENRNSHIITIEDPVEYSHPQKKSRISQREIGTDTKSFNSGLRGALRQDPDVILIGEMRDPETAEIALKAAETGHAVFSTMHTTNSLTTIGRILSMFSDHDQKEVQKRLAENLHAVIGQRMLPGKNGKTIIAQEIMVSTPGIRDCIVGKDDINRIPSIIANGFGKNAIGSQTFDQHVMFLYQKGLISKEVALESVASESDFIQKLIVE